MKRLLIVLTIVAALFAASSSTDALGTPVGGITTQIDPGVGGSAWPPFHCDLDHIGQWGYWGDGWWFYCDGFGDWIGPYRQPGI